MRALVRLPLWERARPLEMTAATVLCLIGLQFILLDTQVASLRIFDALIENTPVCWVQLVTLGCAASLLLPRLLERRRGRRVLAYSFLREGLSCVAGAWLVWLGVAIGSGQLLTGGFGSSLGYAVVGVGLLWETIQRASE